MAFPQVAGYNTSNATGTSHAVSLPSGIVAGNLLLVFVATDGDISWSDTDGFTQLFSVDYTTINSLSVFYKIAVGSDTLTLTSNESEGSAHVSYRITGHDTVQMPEASTGGTGNTTNPDPDSLSPTGGAKDYLWFAAEGNDDDDATTAYPLPDNQRTSIRTDCNVGVCSDELNQATLDPGTFTIAAKETWVACTVAVHPVAAVPDACTADNILSGTPVLGTPTLGQEHALSADNVLSGTPVLGSPAIGQEHALTANNITSGAPVLGTPAVGQVYALTADSILSGTPALGTPTATAIHNLAADNILSGTPSLESPTIGQEHALTANSVATQNPVLGTPVLAEEGGTDDCIADNILSGTPVLGAPTLTEIHNLVADNIGSQSPVLGTPTAAVIHNLVADNILSSAPVIALPTIGQEHGLTADDIYAANPVLGTPTLASAAGVDNLTADSILAQNPILGSPLLAQIVAAQAEIQKHGYSKFKRKLIHPEINEEKELLQIVEFILKTGILD
jgi:hypothetical protein